MSQSAAMMRGYGYFGLLPFIVFSALSLADSDPDGIWRFAYDSYSAVILAFMAGVYWSMSLRGDTAAHASRLMAIAVTLAMLAWVNLVLPGLLRAMSFALAFYLLYLIDRYVLTDYWPADYLLMRGHLTMIVVGSQLLLIVGHLVVA